MNPLLLILDGLGLLLVLDGQLIVQPQLPLHAVLFECFDTEHFYSENSL